MRYGPDCHGYATRYRRGVRWRFVERDGFLWKKRAGRRSIVKVPPGGLRGDRSKKGLRLSRVYRAMSMAEAGLPGMVEELTERFHLRECPVCEREGPEEQCPACGSGEEPKVVETRRACGPKEQAVIFSVMARFIRQPGRVDQDLGIAKNSGPKQEQIPLIALIGIPLEQFKALPQEVRDELIRRKTLGNGHALRPAPVIDVKPIPQEASAPEPVEDPA